MRKFLIAAPLALAAASVLAAPASAATYSHDAYSRDAYKLRSQITQLDRQIDRAEHRRLISSNEADRLDRRVDQLQTMHARYARNGFTRAELRILEQRIDTVQRQLARQIGDRGGYRR